MYRGFLVVSVLKGMTSCIVSYRGLNTNLIYTNAYQKPRDDFIGMEPGAGCSFSAEDIRYIYIYISLLKVM